MSGLFGEADSSPEYLPLLNAKQHDGAFVGVYPKAVDGDSAHQLMQRLRDELAWQQRDIVIFGKRYRQPRLIAWYGDADATYRYSGQTLTPLPWHPSLLDLRERCCELTGSRFNSVLANLYRDGNDAMGWHSDDEAALGEAPLIASVSLGCERRFDLRHKITTETHRLSLPNGSLLMMGGTTQKLWKHQVPRSKKIKDARINLTFRWVF